MVNTVDAYIEDIIRKGDEGSALWSRISAPTLRNSPHVKIIEGGMNGVAVIKIPEDHYAVVHAATGDPDLDNLPEHTASLVERLVEQARQIRATPIGLGNDFNSS